jgi:hypothetical protein
MTTRGLAPDFRGAIEAFAAGSAHGAELSHAFMRSTVYTVRPPGEPALVVLTGEGGPEYVPAWSCLEAMESILDDLDWVACSGGDLIGLIPEGAGVVIDPGLQTCAMIAPGAIGTGVGVEVVGS